MDICVSSKGLFKMTYIWKFQKSGKLIAYWPVTVISHLHNDHPLSHTKKRRDMMNPLHQLLFILLFLPTIRIIAAHEPLHLHSTDKHERGKFCFNVVIQKRIVPTATAAANRRESCFIQSSFQRQNHCPPVPNRGSNWYYH